ncbi:MAG: HPF/RaiA family ribosome-associated protein [Sphingobacteriales bacterium]|nr:MAG: HPF/RaiA family ribosome-associated protein [Sphingobacteriales bacterium]
MNIRVQSVHFDADQKLIDFVKEKAAKLQTFHDKIVDVDVFLKLDNVAHNIKDKIAEIRVAVPKHNYFVKHQSKTFEESFTLAMDSMTNQLKRQKERLAEAE